MAALAPNGQEVADVCESIDVASLEGDALIDYLRTTSESCLKRTLLISNNSSIREDVPTIFSDRNMQSVFAEIEKSASAYDGTNSTGMAHLWFFVQVGYNYHRFFPGETHNERAPGGVGSAGRQGRHLRCRGGARLHRGRHRRRTRPLAAVATAQRTKGRRTVNRRRRTREQLDTLDEQLVEVLRAGLSARMVMIICGRFEPN